MRSPIDESPLKSPLDHEPWKKLEILKPNEKSSREKTQVIKKLASLLEKEKEQLAHLITKTMGKSLKESLIEVDRGLITLESALSCYQQIKGEVYYSDTYLNQEKKYVFTELFPLGCLVLIVPFNFPLNLALHKIVPAYLMGNHFLYKPHPQTYEFASFFLDLLYEAGFSKEDLQMINPSNEDFLKLISHPKIEGISFTGGPIVADLILKNSLGKKHLFELGGNDPLILLEDADLNLGIELALAHRLGCSGQRCTAAKRFFIHESLIEEFEEKLFSKLKTIEASSPYDQNCVLAPLVTEKSAQDLYDQFSSLKPLLITKPKKAYLNPILLRGEENLFKEEFFGPVFPLFSFKTEEEVLNKIHRSSYMLQAGLLTQDQKKIKYFFQHLKTGTLLLNEGPSYRLDHVPFGAFNLSSGNTKEGSLDPFLAMSIKKVFVF